MRLLTTEEAAARLAVHPETLREYLRLGTLRGLKMGRTWKVEESEIAAYVERLKVAAPQRAA